MSVGNSDVTECSELNASLSLFSGESSALDTSIDSVSGTPGKSKGKKKKKKHKHRRHSGETVTSNDGSDKNSGKGKEAARCSFVNSTQDDRNVKHKKNHRKPGGLEDNPDTSQTFAESNSSHLEYRQDGSEAMDVDSSFPSSSDSAHNVENGDEMVITKEKENLDDEDNLWDSFSRKSLDSMKNGQLFESHVKSCRSTRGPTCIICKQSAVQPLKAKCQHICCKDCWRQYIKEHKQCPQCGQHTKKRHLQKLFFPHGHGQ
ncbi:transcriptional repressor NF-X1 homolog [Ptychodera flava]|uniref:transcriptional repressor NF-X1 homolog n=1 Tax=Ptychodera flava TaxID=63121 RepID=UPI00396A7A59